MLSPNFSGKMNVFKKAMPTGELSALPEPRSVGTAEIVRVRHYDERNVLLGHFQNKG
jgi:hypothetical protein